MRRIAATRDIILCGDEFHHVKFGSRLGLTSSGREHGLTLELQYQAFLIFATHL